MGYQNVGRKKRPRVNVIFPAILALPSLCDRQIVGFEHALLYAERVTSASIDARSLCLIAFSMTEN